ncbi:hypothetical protein [Mesorhizobium sp. B4-1-4]|uniref:hypothetical protein n=1 Tax=Mesorhizobium sp. B4-1-4 TaxID=2589888 RepID=UPI00112E3552|nr:hypothetical protein [Mesorhizobium sp. B4-1-4]UCI32089.1 hypothetical protein FJW03_01105 [Mesorhizobium sp. B4-1-4]
MVDFSHDGHGNYARQADVAPFTVLSGSFAAAGFASGAHPIEGEFRVKGFDSMLICTLITARRQLFKVNCRRACLGERCGK